MMRFTLLSLIAFMTSGAAFASVPTSIPYRGLLTQEDGAPFEGELTLEASLYPCEESDCEPVWTSEAIDIEVQDGHVDFVMAESEGNLTDALQSGEALWLQVSLLVDAQWEPMLPRQALSSVPYAVVAHQAENAERLGGVDAADYMLKGEEITWEQIQLPATSIAGLSCDAGEIAVASTAGWECTQMDQSPTQDSLAGLSCIEGQILAWIEGAWGCHTLDAIADASYATTLYVDDAIVGLMNTLSTTDDIEAAIESATMNLASTLYVDDSIVGLANTLMTASEIESVIDSATLNLASTLYVDDAIAAQSSGPRLLLHKSFSLGGKDWEDPATNSALQTFGAQLENMLMEAGAEESLTHPLTITDHVGVPLGQIVDIELQVRSEVWTKHNGFEDPTLTSKVSLTWGDVKQTRNIIRVKGGPTSGDAQQTVSDSHVRFRVLVNESAAPLSEQPMSLTLELSCMTLVGQATCYHTLDVREISVTTF